MTRCRGELIFRIGARPLHTALLTGEPPTAKDEIHGLSRTKEEIETLKIRIAEIVDEVGGKVCTMQPLCTLQMLILLSMCYPRHPNSMKWIRLYLTQRTYYGYLPQALH